MRCNISVSGAVLAADRAAQQLDNAAQLIGVCYVLEGDLGDALAGNLIRIELIAVSEVGQNADLAAGVVTLDVSGRILLGIAVELCLLERIRKGNAVVDHLGENVVGRAVQNAADFVKLVGSQALQHRTDDRNAAADGCLEHVVYAVLLGNLEQLLTLGSNQLLVGGAYALASLEAALGELVRSAHAAHYLGNDCYLGVVLDDREIGYKFIAIRQRGEVAQVEDILYLNRLTNGLGDLVGVHVENLVYARTDSAVSHDCYFNHMLISFHQLN